MRLHEFLKSEKGSGSCGCLLGQFVSLGVIAMEELDAKIDDPRIDGNQFLLWCALVQDDLDCLVHIFKISIVIISHKLSFLSYHP